MTIQWQCGFWSKFFPHTTISPLRKKRYREQIGEKPSTPNEITSYIGRKAGKLICLPGHMIVYVCPFFVWTNHKKFAEECNRHSKGMEQLSECPYIKGQVERRFPPAAYFGMEPSLIRNKCFPYNLFLWDSKNKLIYKWLYCNAVSQIKE